MAGTLNKFSMGSDENNQDPVAAISEFFEEQFDDVDSESGKRAILDRAKTCLKESEGLSSSTFPHKALRAFIERVLPTSSPSVVLEAARLYLLLLKSISVSYNELTFSICLHHVTRLLKECLAKSRPGKSSKKKISTASGQIPVKDYAQFWSCLSELFQKRLLNANDASIASLALQSFCELIRHGKSTDVLDAAVSGVCHVIKGSSNFAVVSSLYKMCIPIARAPLLSANRKALVNVILEAACAEQKMDLSNRRRNILSNSLGTDGADAMEESDEDSPTVSAADKGRFPVSRFLEFCCLNVAERSDDRTSTAKFVHQVISKQSNENVLGFHSFLEKISRCSRTTIRMLTIEIASIMIQNACEDGLSTEMVSGLLQVLQARAQDKMPTVRYKAMHLLTAALQSMPEELRESVNKLLTTGIPCMVGRLRDEKARVRKSATEYVGFACRALFAQMLAPNSDQNADVSHEERGLHSEDSLSDFLTLIGLLKQRCRDASPLVRQEALEELSKTLIVSLHNITGDNRTKVFNSWAEGVLPLVEDGDQRCRSTSIEQARIVAFSEALEKNLREDSMEAEDHITPGKENSLSLFLSFIGGDDQSAAQYGRKLTIALCKDGKIAMKEIVSMCAELKKPDDSDACKRTRRGAWIVLEAIARSGKARDVKRKLGEQTLNKEIDSGNPYAFGIALQMARSMDIGSKAEMAKSVRASLFPSHKSKISSWTPQSIFAAVEFLSSLQHDAGNELLDQCESVVLETGDCTDEKFAEHILQVIGSICAVFKLSRQPPEALLHFMEASASHAQQSSKVRALALSTLGKMCLCESVQQMPRTRSKTGFPAPKNRKIVAVDRVGEELTRRFVAVFVHELENATSSATRNNAVMVLCDLCRQYTAVVEPYIARLASLLTDPSEFVRVQVISSLVSLLQEDYIKIRTGALLYQIAMCLLDSSETVRATAEYALLHVMVQKNSSILASSFVELVFVLNACTACNVYNQFASEMQAVSLKMFEKCDYEKRLEIYQVFLRGMTTEQRIRLPGRLRSDVLALVVDEKLAISDSSVAKVLDDALKLLALDQLCNLSRSKASGEEENNQETSPTEQESQTSGHALLQKVQALELRESTIPVLLQLRKLLERLRSPILKSLMQALCILLRPHRNNLETMVGDPEVRAEIVHEIARPQKEKQLEYRNRARHKRRGAIDSVPETRDTETLGTGRSPDKVAEFPQTPRASGRKPPLEKPSVPRSKRISKRKVLVQEEDDEEEDAEEGDDEIQMGSSCRRLSMKDRICESPKLAALVRRRSASIAQERSMEHNGGSNFATAMARIEGETKS